MNTAPGKRRFAQVAGVVLLIAAAIAAGWLIGDHGTDKAEAAEPVEFLRAGETQDHAFTPPADVRGDVTIEGSGPYGGSGSDYVCDREKLIKYLVAKPDRMRAWARVHAIKPTADSVTRYIRSLRPATLTQPTRVTNYSYENGKAVPFQAILGPGTAVLVDAQGAIRARCRCGNPLLDPVMTASETCQGCPPGLPSSWRLASSYYVLHPSPPRIRGKGWQLGPAAGDVENFRVVGSLPPGYVVEETVVGPDGTERTRTVRFPKPLTRTVTRVVVKKRTVRGPTRIVRVTVPVTRTVTVVKEVPVIKYRDRIVYVGDG